MGIVPLLLAALLAAGPAGLPETWKRPVAAAEVDWSAGTVTAQGGAAADIRMPNPNAARPGAERRARAAALAKLQAALHELGVDKATQKAALDHVSVKRTEYQSNGGVVLWLALSFADVAPGKAAPSSLCAPKASFKLAPAIVGESKVVHAGSATYRPYPAAPACPADAISVTRDDKGRLVLPAASAALIDSFAGAAVVIYVEKTEP